MERTMQSIKFRRVTPYHFFTPEISNRSYLYQMIDLSDEPTYLPLSGGCILEKLI